MIDLIGLTNELIDTDDATRSRIIQQFFYVNRGLQSALLGILDNELPDSDLYREAYNALDTLAKHATERLSQIAPPVSKDDVD